MQRTTLKLAIVAGNWRHQELADAVNRLLPRGRRITENGVTRVVTRRMNPTPEQVAAFAKVLGEPATKLFPEDSEGRDHEQG